MRSAERVALVVALCSGLGSLGVTCEGSRTLAAIDARIAAQLESVKSETAAQAVAVARLDSRVSTLARVQRAKAPDIVEPERRGTLKRVGGWFRRVFTREKGAE